MDASRPDACGASGGYQAGDRAPPPSARIARLIGCQNSMASPSVISEPTRPLAQKIAMLPCDSSIACRKLDSAMSPSTRASTSGASG